MLAHGSLPAPVGDLVLTARGGVLTDLACELDLFLAGGAVTTAPTAR